MLIVTVGPVFLICLGIAMFGDLLQGMWLDYWKAKGKKAKCEFDRAATKIVIGCGVFALLLFLVIPILPVVREQAAQRQGVANQKKQYESVVAYGQQQAVAQAAALVREEARRQEDELAQQREDSRNQQEEAERAEKIKREAIEKAQNDPLAKRLFALRLKRASEGQAEYQFDLALQYLTGQGVAKDASVAKEWLQKAAVQGHQKAQKQLADLGGVSK